MKNIIHKKHNSSSKSMFDKDDACPNLLLAAFFFGVIIYHMAFSFEIITHPYMRLLLYICFGFGGLNLGTGISKMYFKK